MKSNVRTRCSWFTNIPIGVCIFFIVIGLLLGNVFVIVTWHEGKLIDRSEALPITSTFRSYTTHTSPKGSLNEIEIFFYDRESVCMRGACIKADVIESLEKLQSGDKVDLLLHPISNYVWQMQSEEETILSFETSRRQILTENIAFSGIGVFCYLLAIMGAISLFVQWKECRKAITKRS